ncbi:glycosyltransferase family 4 protein [Francisella hispaniensis]|uniref:Glycosyl transferase n=1 Tax=Francisella hispaniensis FSC454 TaxID=1088883 RepID=A0AAC9NQA8_9GAMM|nr:glycosyltransferase [Francisella hispaniensis]APD50922.1 glycosyl transferase [Francisella hispaniensis FSC454]KYW82699.1 glycosyl transferase [Francisella hispaniensis FSC454]
MKKIVHLIINLNQGGAEAMLYKLCKSMDKSTYHITVISLMGRGVFANKLEACGVKVYTLDLNKFNVLFVLFKYIKIIRRIKPDVIHAWMYHANVISILCKPFYRKAKYINSIRTGLENYDGHKNLTKFMIKLNAKLSKFSDLTLNNSKKSLEDHQNIGFKNQCFIANGFDKDVFKPSFFKYEKFRLNNDLDDNVKIIGIIARNHANKNISRFLEIANLLVKNDSNLRFLIAGRECSKIDIGSYLDNKSNVNKFFVFESVDSSEYLPVLDLYLSTSKVEGFPNILAEAILCEVPIVASNVGDCKDILNGYGEIFELADSNKQVVEKIINVLKIDSNIRSAMRDYVKSNYSIKNVVDMHERLYG